MIAEGSMVVWDREWGEKGRLGGFSVWDLWLGKRAVVVCHGGFGSFRTGKGEGEG